MWIDQENEDEKNLNQEQDSLTNPSIGSGAGGGGSEPGNGAGAEQNQATSVAKPAAPQQNFATIQDYFKANKTQGENFGQQFSSKLADTATQQRNTITGAADAARSEVKSKTPIENTYLTARAASDPFSVTSDTGSYDKLMAQYNAAYAGPSSFEESDAYSGAVEATQKAKEKQEQLKSVGGRQQLIQDEFGVYGQGNRGLDEGLLQTSSVFPKVQEQEKEFGGLQDYLKTKGAELTPDVEAAKKEAEKTRASTRATIGSGLQKFVGDVDTNVEKAKTGLASQTEAVQRALANPNAVNDAVLKTLGLTRNEFDKLQKDKAVAEQGWMAPGDKAGQIAGKSFNLADYLKTSPLDVSRRTTVSDADINKAKGFAQITQDQNILPTVGDKATPGSFATFDKTKAMNELGGYAGNISAAQKAYQDKLNATRPSTPSSPSDGVLRSQPVLPSDGSGGQSGSNTNPAVNPEYNPNNIQFDNKGNPITPEGATGVFKTPDGVWTPIADMKGVQTETSSITPHDLQTVDNQGGTEKTPYIGDKTVQQIKAAVDMRTNVPNQDPQTKAQFQAMGNDLSVLYARKLAGTLTAQDSQKLNQYASMLGLNELATGAVPTDLNQYLADQRIAPPAQPTNPDGSTMTAAQKRIDTANKSIQALVDRSNYYGKKELAPMVSQFQSLYPKYVNGQKMTNQEAKTLQQLAQKLGVRL